MEPPPGMDFPSPASQVTTIDVRFAKSSAPRCLRTATKIAIRKSQMKSGVPDRLRSGDLLHERQACCLDYTTGTAMERVNGIAPSSRPWHGRILLLNHTRKRWSPQPDSHRQPDA